MEFTKQGPVRRTKTVRYCPDPDGGDVLYPFSDPRSDSVLDVPVADVTVYFTECGHMWELSGFAVQSKFLTGGQQALVEQIDVPGDDDLPSWLSELAVRAAQER